MKDNTVVNSHSGTTELPDGTELKVIVENFEKPLFPMGTPIMAACKVEYVKLRGTRWIGNYFETHYPEDEMKAEVDYIIGKIKEDPESYKFQHAPK